MAREELPDGRDRLAQVLPELVGVSEGVREGGEREWEVREEERGGEALRLEGERDEGVEVLVDARTEVGRAGNVKNGAENGAEVVVCRKVASDGQQEPRQKGRVTYRRRALTPLNP